MRNKYLLGIGAGSLFCCSENSAAVFDRYAILVCNVQRSSVIDHACIDLGALFTPGEAAAHTADLRKGLCCTLSLMRVIHQTIVALLGQAPETYCTAKASSHPIRADVALFVFTKFMKV
jgi:hypothetical protein